MTNKINKINKTLNISKNIRQVFFITKSFTNTNFGKIRNFFSGIKNRKEEEIRGSLKKIFPKLNPPLMKKIGYCLNFLRKPEIKILLTFYREGYSAGLSRLKDLIFTTLIIFAPGLILKAVRFLFSEKYFANLNKEKESVLKDLKNIRFHYKIIEEKRRRRRRKIIRLICLGAGLYLVYVVLERLYCYLYDIDWGFFEIFSDHYDKLVELISNIFNFFLEIIKFFLNFFQRIAEFLKDFFGLDKRKKELEALVNSLVNKSKIELESIIMVLFGQHEHELSKKIKTLYETNRNEMLAAIKKEVSDQLKKEVERLLAQKEIEKKIKRPDPKKRASGIIK